MLRFLSSWGPLLLWACLIFVASSLPGDALPAFGLFRADLLAHLLIYAVFAGALSRALRLDGRIPLSSGGRAAAVLALTVCYGMSDEAHQAFVPGREPSFADLAADGAGALLFLAVDALRARWGRAGGAGNPHRREERPPKRDGG
ncbi:MAG: VanZ family protein [Bacteroidota bacterium]